MQTLRTSSRPQVPRAHVRPFQAAPAPVKACVAPRTAALAVRVRRLLGHGLARQRGRLRACQPALHLLLPYGLLNRALAWPIQQRSSCAGLQKLWAFASSPFLPQAELKVGDKLEAYPDYYRVLKSTAGGRRAVPRPWQA